MAWENPDIISPWSTKESTYILPDPDHTDHITLLISSRCGVQKDFQSKSSLRHKRKLKVSSLLSV